jgi:hypothetical protein
VRPYRPPALFLRFTATPAQVGPGVRIRLAPAASLQTIGPSREIRVTREHRGEGRPPTRLKDKIRAGSEAPIDLIRSAHDRSAVRAGAACSVRTAGAIDGSSVVGVFANHRSSIGSSTACSIYTIGANYRIRMMAYSEPAENDDDRERIFPHDCLPVASLTMLPVIEDEQPRPYRRWATSATFERPNPARR